MFGWTVKSLGLDAVPVGVDTVTGPVNDPLGTVAVICVSESTVNDAATPLKRTLVVPTKPEPVITIGTPIVARLGSKLLMTGSAARATAGRPTTARITESRRPRRSVERIVISAAS